MCGWPYWRYSARCSSSCSSPEIKEDIYIFAFAIGDLVQMPVFIGIVFVPIEAFAISRLTFIRLVWYEPIQ
jgi:hypothetical protein